MTKFALFILKVLASAFLRCEHLYNRLLLLNMSFTLYVRPSSHICVYLAYSSKNVTKTTRAENRERIHIPGDVSKDV